MLGPPAPVGRGCGLRRPGPLEITSMTETTGEATSAAIPDVAASIAPSADSAPTDQETPSCMENGAVTEGTVRTQAPRDESDGAPPSGKNSGTTEGRTVECEEGSSDRTGSGEARSNAEHFRRAGREQGIADERKYKRFEWVKEIDIRVDDPAHSTRVLRVTTHNLSRGGFGFLYKQYIHIGTKVIVCFEGGSDGPRLRGTVRECVDLGEGQHYVGVKFIDDGVRAPLRRPKVVPA